MSIKDRLQADMIAAMKAREQSRLDCIRFMSAAIKKVEIDTRKSLDDAAVTGILMNLAKQRRDSIEQFRKGGREDLATKEETELKLLQSYLPAQMTAEDLGSLVDQVIKETGAISMKDMGNVIKAVMAKAAGQAEGGAVSDVVKKKLNKS